MSTKQEALKVVVAAIATAGEKVLRTDRNPEWLWWRDSTPEALNHVKQQLAAEKGGSEAAYLIGCALRVFETGQCSEKSWKIVRLELDDTKKHLEAAIESELVKEVVDSVSHITGDKKLRAEGLTLAGVLYAVAGDSTLAETQRKLAEANETNSKLAGLCNEAKDELAKVRKELEELKAQKPDPGSTTEAWHIVCMALHDRLPAWNENNQRNAAQNADAAIRQLADEVKLLKAHGKAWRAICDVLHEVDPNWLASGTSAKDSAADFIRVLAQKAKDTSPNLLFRQLVTRELGYKVPGWLTGGDSVAVSAVRAIQELAGKKEALEHLKAANERLRAKVDSAAKVLNS